MTDTTIELPRETLIAIRDVLTQANTLGGNVSEGFIILAIANMCLTLTSQIKTYPTAGTDRLALHLISDIRRLLEIMAGDARHNDKQDLHDRIERLLQHLAFRTMMSSV